MRRIVLLLAVVFLVGSIVAGKADARRKPKAPAVVETEDGDLVHMHLEGNEAAQGWLFKTTVEEDDEGNPVPVDLYVALHGAGGNPKNFIMRRLMASRDAFCLTVAGRSTVQTDNGQGHMWDGGDVSTIAALTRHVIEKYPIDKERVVVWGHSAGGSMTLATLTHAPELYAGGLTTASPRTPAGGHKDKRICVMLGDKDPNWVGAGAIRNYLEGLAKKRAKGACAFFHIEGLEHKLPSDAHLDFGFDWVLATGTRGGEAKVPMRLVGTSGDLSHILLTHKKAKKSLRGIQKAVSKGKAWFPFEAACHSDHEETASGGGWIAEDELKAMLGELPALEPGQVSDVLKSDQGLHLVWRPKE